MGAACRCCKSFCKEFQEFALRGNAIDLAIGIIIGAAFTNVIQSLVDDIVTPPVGLILGGVDFVNLTIKMKNFVYKDQPPVVIRYGKFLQTILSLLITTFALFFVIKSFNHLRELTKKKKPKEETTLLEMNDDVRVLCEIRDILKQQSLTTTTAESKPL